jgi:hypothetical protein
MVLIFYLTVVPDAPSRAGRDVASDVVGRLALAEWLAAAVAGREAKYNNENCSLISIKIK